MFWLATQGFYVQDGWHKYGLIIYQMWPYSGLLGDEKCKTEYAVY